MHFKISKGPNISLENKLLLTILLNLAITVSEIMGGFLSKSLALLSDAFHNFSDVFSLIVSFFAIKISKKEKTEKNTFGFKRAEILAALFNLIILFFAIIYIIFESIKRFFSEVEINSQIMLIITLIGFIANLISVLFLHRETKINLNVRSSFLHLLGDTFSSIGVLITATIISFFPKFHLLDSIISFIISAYMLIETWKLFSEISHILMQGTPKKINIEKIKQRLIDEKELALVDVHHIHSWVLSTDEIIFDCHVVIKNDMDIKNINKKIKKINQILKNEFNIKHATIQVETEGFEHEKFCDV